MKRRILNYFSNNFPEAFSFSTNSSDSDSQFCWIGKPNEEFLLINHLNLSHVKNLCNNYINEIESKKLIWFEEFTQELNTDYNISDDIFKEKPITKQEESNNRIKEMLRKLYDLVVNGFD